MLYLNLEYSYRIAVKTYSVLNASGLHDEMHLYYTNKEACTIHTQIWLWGTITR